MKARRSGYRGFLIVEKADHLAVHGMFCNLETAEKFLEIVIPEYVKRGFFMNKNLNAQDFCVIHK